MNKNALLLLLLVSCNLLIFNSCKLNDVDDPTVIVDIEDEFSVEMWEALSPTTPSFQLRATTISEESCLNYEIEYQIIRRSNRIRASIDDIVEPDDCLPGKATPEVEMEIGIVDNGLYEFEINLKNSTIVNTGQLVVTNESYTVDMSSTNGITLQSNELLRVPNGTVWGYLSAKDLEPIAIDFFNELSELTTDKSFLEGNYGYFSITGDNKINLPLETTFSEVQPFIINYISSIKKLETIISDYRNQYGADLELKIFTWEGDVF